MRTVSLALTHFNRFDFLIESFAQVLDDQRIAEIVIVDDASTDGSWVKILDWAVGLPTHQKKIRAYRNPVNVDCYRNKERAVSLCRRPWVILFDSDNILTPAYFDALYAIPEWDLNTFYCPVFAEPHFDYRAFEQRTVDRVNVARFMPQPHFATALNTANYLVPREGWLEAWDGTTNPHTADSIYMAYRWLLSGGRLHFVKGLHYFHRVHQNSHYKQNVHKTGGFAREVERNLNLMK